MKIRSIIRLTFIFCTMILVQKMCENSIDKSGKTDMVDFQELLTDSSSSVSPVSSELNVPRQINISSVPRTASNANRNGFSRNPGSILVKSGKLLCSNTYEAHSRNLKLFPSGFTEPEHHLISLGKLVI